MHDNTRSKQIINNTGAQGFFHTGKLNWRIHAHERIIAAALDTENFVFFRDGKADEVCNVVFAALVAVVQVRQKALHRSKAAIVHARVNLVGRRPVERGIIILGFHNGLDLALLAHHPAIRAGVVQLNGGKSQIGPNGLGKKRTNQRFRKQGRIAVDHQQMGATGFCQCGQSLNKGMACAKLLFLQHKAGIRKGGLHHFGAMPGHNPDVFRKNRAQSLNDAGKHWLAQQRLQHLGPVRVHAGSLARCKNQSRVLRHEYLLRSPHMAGNCAGRPIASCGPNSKTAEVVCAVRRCSGVYPVPTCDGRPITQSLA